jgi:hypothetical protein
MFRKLAFVMIAVSVLAAAAPAQNERQRRVQSRPSVSARTPNVTVGAAAPATFARLPFAPAEVLSYTIDWNNYLTAARLELAVAERGKFFGQEGLKLTANVRTIGLVRTLMAAVDSKSESYVDPRTLLPFRAERQTTINNRSDSGVITFDRTKNTASVEDSAPVPINADTGDTLTLFYRVRALPLKVGDKLTLEGFEGKKLVQVQATVEAREEISTPSGPHKTVRVAFMPIRNDAPDDRDRIRVWYTDDASHVPVLITAEPSIGSIRIALASASTPKGGSARQ